MFSKGIIKNILFLICAICIQITQSQEIRVIDNKGTLKTAINNSVTSSITQPSLALEGDLWFDTSTTPTLIKIYNDGSWMNFTNTSTSGSVFFAAPNGLPTENNSQFFWDNPTNTLKAKNVSIPSKLLDSNGDSGTANQVLSSTATGTDWITNTNWLINGNSGTTASNFLGTIDDVRMQIRSDNLPMLEFGRRGTLGLDQIYPDYTDVNQPLVHLGGDGSTAALQFAAAGASFYKPMFFTTTNGSFRLKGSAGSTDLFEIGSAGPANDGRLEFIVGDDGGESIIFKRYDYSSRSHKEFFRVQGSADAYNSKPRFGINLNPTGVPVDPSYNNADTGVMANSTFQVNGSVSKSILTTSGNLLLSEDHHTIILGGNHTITLPGAATCLGRVYVIKNPNTYATTISGYVNEQGVTGIATVNSATTLWLQSDGTNWQQISNKSSASIGKSLFSVTTTPANSNTYYDPTTTTSWVQMNSVLPTTSITVQTGDIVDVRVNISEQLGNYNYIGDAIRLYITSPNLVGSPTMIETLIAGGDNTYEVAAASLSQMFTVTSNGTLTIGIEIRFADGSPRTFSSVRAGQGALQAIIYR
jgi:hypothetical protein